MTGAPEVGVVDPIAGSAADPVDGLDDATLVARASDGDVHAFVGVDPGLELPAARPVWS